MQQRLDTAVVSVVNDLRRNALRLIHQHRDRGYVQKAEALVKERKATYLPLMTETEYDFLVMLEMTKLGR